MDRIKLSVIVGIALLLGWAGFLGFQHLSLKKELDTQAQFFAAEKKLLTISENFEKAELESKNPDKKSKDKKAKSEEKSDLKLSTGDFSADYGTATEELTKLIETHSKSKAAKLAALNVSEVQIKYSKYNEAEAILKKVFGNEKDLLNALVQKQLGTVLASQEKCQEAIDTWSKILVNSKAKALHGEIKLNQGLCYEKLKDLAKAEELYNQAKLSDPQSQVAKSAEKYLRSLKVN